MRLGEGSGAAVCYPLIEQSLSLYLEMESFEKAEVTNSVSLLKQKGSTFENENVTLILGGTRSGKVALVSN